MSKYGKSRRDCMVLSIVVAFLVRVGKTESCGFVALVGTDAESHLRRMRTNV